MSEVSEANITPATEVREILASVKKDREVKFSAYQKEYCQKQINSINIHLLNAAKTGREFTEERIESWAIPKITALFEAQGYYVEVSEYESEHLKFEANGYTRTIYYKDCRFYINKPEASPKEESLVLKFWRSINHR